MAKNNGTTRLMPAEIYGLADRLHEHGRHVAFAYLPDIKRDISLASRIMKYLLERGVIVDPIELE